MTSPLTLLLAFLRRDYVRLAVLSAAASAVAFAASSATPAIDATVAALTALISVRPTFHDTAAESLRQVFGTLLGAIVGLGLTTAFGSTSSTMFVLVLFTFIVARYLRLGVDGAMAMGVTVILVLGPLSNVGDVEQRFAGVFVGALVALVTSLWVRPGLPHNRALAEALTLTDSAAHLLTRVSAHLREHAGTVDPTVARSWLDEAEQIMTDLARVKTEAESAATTSRWSPLVNRQEAEAVLDQVRIAQVTARTVHGMCQDLCMAAQNDHQLPEDLAVNMAGVLDATADAIYDQADAARQQPAQTLPTDQGAVQEWEATRSDAIVEMKASDHTQAILIAGSILRDTEKITDALTDSPAAPGAASAQVPARRSRRRALRKR